MSPSDAVQLAASPQDISSVPSGTGTLEGLKGKADSIPKFLYPKK